MRPAAPILAEMFKPRMNTNAPESCRIADRGSWIVDRRRSHFFILFPNNQSQITNNSSPPRSPLRLGVSILQKTEEARSDEASSFSYLGHLIRTDLCGMPLPHLRQYFKVAKRNWHGRSEAKEQRSLPICHSRSFSFAVSSSFLKCRRREAASPYRQKRQDFKKQDSRKAVGSPTFTCPPNNP